MMKQSLLIGGATAMGAVAAVVLMKNWPAEASDGMEEGTQVAEGSAATGQGASASEAATTSESDRALSARNPDEAPAEAPEIDAAALEERRDEFRSQMRERQMDRLTDKMAKWSAALGLDESQQGELLDLANAQFDEMEAMAAAVEGGDPGELSDKARRAMAIMSGRALEESMVDLLTPSQREKYQEFENAQTQNRAEAGALRQLATLQEELMLTPEQRNDAYGIIYADQLARAEENSDVSSMIKEFAGQSGLNVDPALQGMISSIAEKGLARLASGEEMDGEGIRELAEGAMTSSVEEQVELLRPVLTEGQLELYRGQLSDRLKNLENLIPGNSDGQ